MDETPRTGPGLAPGAAEDGPMGGPFEERCPDCGEPTEYGDLCDDCGEERDHLDAEDAGELPRQQAEVAKR